MERQDELSFSAVISAAGQVSSDLARRMGTAEKCAAQMEGEPICRAALTAALGAGVSQVAVVCGPETRDALGTLPENCNLSEPGAGPVESAKSGVNALSAPRSILFLPGDLPFVQPAHVASFLARCPRSTEPWVAAGVCSEPDVTARFPGIPGMKYLRLSGERYAGGGIFAASAQGFEVAVSLATKFSQDRKSMLRMALQFGLVNVLRLLASRMSIARAERAGSKLFGCEARIITGCSPELIADVDTVEDWEFTQLFHRRQIR